jgi:hypothetical protein
VQTNTYQLAICKSASDGGPLFRADARAFSELALAQHNLWVEVCRTDFSGCGIAAQTTAFGTGWRAAASFHLYRTCGRIVFSGGSGNVTISGCTAWLAM